LFIIQVYILAIYMEAIYLKCPHCKEYVEILKSQFNCKIFRHGIFKSSFLCIDPHLGKKEIDDLLKSNLIYGCGGPFRLIGETDETYELFPCDYI